MRQFVSVVFLRHASVVASATAATTVLLLGSCGGNSKRVENDAERGGSGAPHAGEGGTDTDAGRGQGGTSGMTGNTGGVSVAGDAGRAGSGGSGAAGGAPVECPTDGSECPTGCFELPLTTGCGADLRRSRLCTEAEFDPPELACGVREADGTVFYVDAPFDLEPVVNAFFDIEGFRPCTQSEVDDSDCRDLDDVPPSRSVRFDVTNAGTGPLWLAVGADGCSLFGIDRAPDWEELIIDLVRPCGSSCNSGGDIYAYAEVVRLEPGEGRSLEWDGRAAETAPTIRVCDERISDGNPWTENMDDRCIGGRIVPVAPGRYRVAIGASSDPAGYFARNCRDAASCTFGLDIFGVASYEERCFGDLTSTLTEFDVPETGDVVVPVMIGE